MERADIQNAAEVIAKLLGETEKSAILKIELLIEHLGIDFIQTQVEETQRIEADGGLMTDNNERRRTTGGVFFNIVKSKINPEQHALLFPPPDWKKRKARAKRKKQAKKLAEQNKTQKDS